ncbi:phosphoribosylglycinamide formyltransferase [Texcoconibacillus texcoconensis]|uniref:Phosphoribosylglycinamide formyltransferase n=1 Tax=Texcoconibacillus texcoconensis TaxID=1095777 RepID=A0A840QMG5_9BACI|nr:phosphoribosylglycinamide formyltransferase [Texcoconibacillus texcoconensis]MBB5172558.1 phosphoribosylglycinamide formyltransferase-1 [Texcoconibacillus texcoconensis]
MTNIAVFASGTGSNFEVIVEAVENGSLDANIALLVSDRSDADVLRKAEKVGVPTLELVPKNFDTKAGFEVEILQHLRSHQIEWVILAGYMRLVGPTLLEAYSGKIVNIHPSLLPSFPGLHAPEQALKAGVKVTGVTIHYVDEGMDTGPIIAQEPVKISENETLASLKKKIQYVEHDLYPKTIQSLIQRERKGGASNEKTSIS